MIRKKAVYLYLVIRTVASPQNSWLGYAAIMGHLWITGKEYIFDTLILIESNKNYFKSKRPYGSTRMTNNFITVTLHSLRRHFFPGTKKSNCSG